jgi:hypothetical protein
MINPMNFLWGLTASMALMMMGCAARQPAPERSQERPEGEPMHEQAHPYHQS